MIPPKILSDRMAELQKNQAFDQIREAVLAAMRAGAPAEGQVSPNTPQSTPSPQPLSEQPTERAAGSAQFQNPVPSHEVSGNVPHAQPMGNVSGTLADSPSQLDQLKPVMFPVHKIFGIPEGTTRAVPEQRKTTQEGFDSTWRGTTGETERGKLPAMAKASSMAPGDRSEFVAESKHVPPMDRDVRSMVNRDPEWNGSPPKRAFKAAPRRSVYRARGL